MRRPHVEIWGEARSETVLLLHGSFAADPAAKWAKQRDLADRYRLVLPHRLGYGAGGLPENAGEPGYCSLEADVQAIAALLEPGSHIVGFSYGGLVGLLLAAQHAELVGSLALIEPPLYGLLRGDREVEDLIERLQPVYGRVNELAPEEYYRAFLQALGAQVEETGPLAPDRRQAVKAAMKEAVPWEVELPLAKLKSWRFPKLVISGNWNQLLERLCDVLATELGAERAIIPGAGHGVQRTGQSFNDRIAALWQQAAAGR